MGVSPLMLPLAYVARSQGPHTSRVDVVRMPQTSNDGLTVGARSRTQQGRRTSVFVFSLPVSLSRSLSSSPPSRFRHFPRRFALGSNFGGHPCRVWGSKSVSVLRAACTYAAVIVVVVVSSCATGPAWQSAAVPFAFPARRAALACARLTFPRFPFALVICAVSPFALVVCRLHTAQRRRLASPSLSFPWRHSAGAYSALQSSFWVLHSALGGVVLAFCLWRSGFWVLSRGFSIWRVLKGWEMEGGVRSLADGLGVSVGVCVSPPPPLAYVAVPKGRAQHVTASSARPSSYASSSHDRVFDDANAPMYSVLPFPFCFHSPSRQPCASRTLVSLHRSSLVHGCPFSCAFSFVLLRLHSLRGSSPCAQAPFVLDEPVCTT